MMSSMARSRLVTEIIAPIQFEPTEAVWRDLAEETWAVLKNTERLAITKPLELHFRSAVMKTDVLESIAHKWLERLSSSNEDLAIRLLRSEIAKTAVLERLSETARSWLEAANNLQAGVRLMSMLVDTAARLLLSSTLSQQLATPQAPTAAERSLCVQRMVQEVTQVTLIQSLIGFALRPVEREFFRSEDARLLEQVWMWLNHALQGESVVGVVASPPQKSLAHIVEAARIIPTFSGQAMQSVDRAVRTPDNWKFPDYDAPVFHDDSNQHVVRYQDEGVTLEQLQIEVRSLAPRTADVLRLITARSLDAWQEGHAEPPAVWVDARELCEMMGYQKAKRGGFRTEQVASVTKALVDLERLWVEIPKGTFQYPIDPKSKKRTKTTLEASRSYRVFSVMGKDELRDLFGNRYPLRWKVRPGEWIQWYPRQFAPLLAKIVELPASGTINTWAKSLGTELTYQYRQDRSRSIDKTLTVERLLLRAGVLNEVMDWSRNRNATRARAYFEKAMDELQNLGVCERWEFHPEDFDALEASGNKRWFDLWLSSRIIVTAPQWLIDRLPELEKKTATTTPVKPNPSKPKRKSPVSNPTTD
jgi:hypothetical protein